MTDKDWIKQLQTMMEHHEEPIADDLWQDIEARLPEQQAHSRVMPAWRRYAAAAAVALAVVGIGGLLWHGGNDAPVDKPAISLTHQEASTPAHEALAQNDLTSPNVDAPAVSHQVAQSPLVKKSPTVAIAQGHSDLIAQTNNPTETAPPQAPSENEPVEPSKEQPDQPDQPVEKPDMGHIHVSPTPNASGQRITMPSRKRLPVSFEFYASNTIKPERLSSNDGVFASHLYTQMNDEFDPYSLMDSIYYPKFLKSFQKHHAPYSFGVSVRLPLSDRLALTSGLVYTCLKSDFTLERSEQTLHYLGVPIGATYALWQIKRFSVYAIGGMQADFNIKATVKRKNQSSDVSIGKDRVQFSGLLGPGLQLDVMQDFGIYVEPTVRYYFNNGSDVENYFKDKPWNINLNAGLRITLQ